MSQQTILPKIQITVPSGRFAAREALKRLMADLGPLDLDIEEAGTVELVMAEAINNVVEHGYPDPEKGGPIRISCSHKADGLSIQMIDYGLRMPNGETPLGLSVQTDVDFMDMPEGGFGWFIIKDLAKDVVYRRVGDMNQLDLRIAIAISTQGTKVKIC